jgi:RNA polymerase sigma-54 factor
MNALQLRQNLKLTQQLVMTPQLQQAIKLLQLSRVELVEKVQQALLENPLLEERQQQEPVEGQQGESGSHDEVKEFRAEEGALLKSAEWEDYLGEFSSSSRRSTESEYLEEVASFETFYAAKPSLESHLSWQLHLSDFTDKEKEIGEIIIGNLSSEGHLEASVEEMAANTGYTPDEVESVLHRIQYFDPVGVAARTLQECLEVQLRFLNKDDPVIFALIRDHLEDLEQNNIQALAKKFNVTPDQIQQYFLQIQELDPRPGSSFGGGETIYITPDAYIYKFDDEFVIVLNDEDIPDLQISQQYMDQLNKKDGKEKDYLQEQMHNALWLLKSIQQRQRTLYRVLESIVRFQRDFFEHGVTHLKPLVLKEVAEDIEVHESTVSRITTHKYVSTPFGIFELKFFFNSGLGMDGGGQVSSESVKASIRKMVSGEDSAKPLSDKHIASMLNQQLQVNIARRTVAKYRESMGIPSSTKRKKVRA